MIGSLNVIIKPPQSLSSRDYRLPSVFLAGTIDNGNSKNWQELLSKELTYYYNVLNPRRDDWDATWDCSIINPQFYQQVDWEHEAMKLADEIFFYIAPNSQSPITLQELGLYARSKRIIGVVSPGPYWRQGNVEFMCMKYNIPFYTDLKIDIQNIFHNIPKMLGGHGQLKDYV